MIETIENALQVAVSLLCCTLAILIAYRKKNHVYSTLALFYAAISLGDLYWILYLVFYRATPQYSYVSEVAFYAAYLFLLLLLRLVQSDQERAVKSPVLWLIPIFTGSMCIFYMQWGDYISNLITALLMALLLWRSLQGLLYKESREPDRKWLFASVLVFCLIEYAMWTFSCFWAGDSITNPYFLFDLLFTVCIALFLPALGKAVRA